MKIRHESAAEARRQRSTERIHEEHNRVKIEEKIDRDLEDSFPASDPPGWTLGVGRLR